MCCAGATVDNHGHVLVGSGFLTAGFRWKIHGRGMLPAPARRQLSEYKIPVKIVLFERVLEHSHG